MQCFGAEMEVSSGFCVASMVVRFDGVVVVVEGVEEVMWWCLDLVPPVCG
jgi:hypothetical protein